MKMLAKTVAYLLPDQFCCWGSEIKIWCTKVLKKKLGSHWN